jgi:hypothetical protein
VRKAGGYIQLAFAAFWLIRGPVGWALTSVPFILVAAMSGSVLAATTGLAAGVLVLGTATAGFHDLGRPASSTPA